MKWEFTLSGETFDGVTFLRNDLAIGRKDSQGKITIQPTSNFQERFAISASDQATLIIYNVTEADEAVFTCDVRTSVRNWIDKIKVKVDSEYYFNFYVILMCNSTRLYRCVPSIAFFAT